METRVKSRLWRDARAAVPSSGSEGTGEMYVLGSKLATAVKSTHRSSSCNSRNLGLAAYSSAPEKVPGDRKASSSNSGPAPLKESAILPSDIIEASDSFMVAPVGVMNTWSGVEEGRKWSWSRKQSAEAKLSHDSTQPVVRSM